MDLPLRLIYVKRMHGLYPSGNTSSAYAMGVAFC